MKFVPDALVPIGLFVAVALSDVPIVQPVIVSPHSLCCWSQACIAAIVMVFV